MTPPTPGGPGGTPDDAPRDYDDAVHRAGYRGVFGPATSFLGLPRCDQGPTGYAGADVVILGAPFDGTTSHRPGARFGPQAIRRADYLPHVPYRPHLGLGIDPFGELTVVDAGDVPTPPGETEQAHALLERAVGDVVAAGAVPFTLGGDHSVAWPAMRGIAGRRGAGTFSVIHFDAHADIGDTSDFGTKYGHGTVMRRVLEAGIVPGDRFVQIGLRGYWPGPRTLAWASELGVRSVTMHELRSRGLDACLAAVLAQLGDGPVYLTIDIDVVDPGMAPGTGTPEPGGLTSRELLDAVRTCAQRTDLVGAEVVEVSPPYDGPGEITAFLANRVVLEVLSGMAWRRRAASQAGNGGAPS
ncbi:agmatinase [Streptomyces mobaraensis NBRC 13819 = DSM 40847]|uniref:Agmatinase n=2 Tax=Streptomyces mobaraensis TaxID=35621 RepID=A0A5N5W9G6_STRMB|nr:agmatinase [Streptomyces mobaraensis]EMF01218.1 agmatinase [Streptomyces mobaraensis NBRC 13819 = DSM 40847]KAB7846931.1 agmatinase [Streptomyces mobaraensis]QTT76636.1 agmatinase [Streptomyces mobaraensis NBRC 13819 = DSM 40847]